MTKKAASGSRAAQRPAVPATAFPVRFRFLTAPLVTHTPFGNLEILTHIPRDGETAVSFHEMSLQTPAQAYQFGSWPEKVWG
jgi:hypothetical protein